MLNCEDSDNNLYVKLLSLTKYLITVLGFNIALIANVKFYNSLVT